jgi:hypothetical protein
LRKSVVTQTINEKCRRAINVTAYSTHEILADSIQMNMLARARFTCYERNEAVVDDVSDFVEVLKSVNIRGRNIASGHRKEKAKNHAWQKQKQEATYLHCFRFKPENSKPQTGAESGDQPCSLPDRQGSQFQCGKLTAAQPTPGLNEMLQSQPVPIAAPATGRIFR